MIKPRSNILALTPYSSARDEYKGRSASVFLDANESPCGVGSGQAYNRYPDPLQLQLKSAIARVKGVKENSIFLGNGSDEAIDLLFRAYCEPRQDNVVAIEPTYGMYSVCAQINDVEYRRVNLDDAFNFSADSVLAAADGNTKLIFLCSPNNPTGNNLSREEIVRCIRNAQCLVVLDEAYIDFSIDNTFLRQLGEYENLVVLQTFSKAYASAGIRLGMAFADEEIINVLNRIKYPYNINQLTQEQALEVLSRHGDIQEQVAVILQERERMSIALRNIEGVQTVYPSDANFLLVRMADAKKAYNDLVDKGIIVRNRSHIALCGNCLRITIGTPQENNILLSVL